MFRPLLVMSVRNFSIDVKDPSSVTFGELKGNIRNNLVACGYWPADEHNDYCIKFLLNGEKDKDQGYGLSLGVLSLF